MKRLNRILSKPSIMNGQPCISGTRLTVRRILLALAQYVDQQQLHKDYPQLQEEDIRQVLEYAATKLDGE